MRSIFFLSLLILTGCTTSKWMDDTNWYNTGRAVNDSLVDVFYIVSTEVLNEKDDNGNDLFLSRNTDSEREAIAAEMRYADKMFGDSLNFFSPYYSQFTLSALTLPADEMRQVQATAAMDATEAFRYYMQYINNGRPFILAGFSQGAMHLVNILSNLQPEEYERMVAAYCMGYRLTAENLENPYINAAQNDSDHGVTISFNSVASLDAVWDMVSRDAATCINPVNYRTDEQPATFLFNDDTFTVKVDTTQNILIVEGENLSDLRFPMLDEYCKPGNLHHWDLLFYRDAIHRNALHRAYHTPF